MQIKVREFTINDIDNKIKWINSRENSRFLHYQLPLTREKTVNWFLSKSKNRYDGVIEVDSIPIGVIGLLNIDSNTGKAEYYITIGEDSYKGKGIAYKASQELLSYAFNVLNLNLVYLTTEIENKKMQRLARKLNFVNSGFLQNFTCNQGKLKDCYYYSITKKNFNLNITNNENKLSEIEFLNNNNNNNYFIKRDDLIGFSLGGNKARKLLNMVPEIKKRKPSVIVTYGSSQSNHCRVVSNYCYSQSIKCVIISPHSKEKEKNLNRRLCSLCGAKIIECDVSRVGETIDKTVAEYETNGEKVYFIPGGGHSTIGTDAYVKAYNEIKLWESEHGIFFDYIFLASGTGTTQAGLIAGKYINMDIDKKIIGISVAREKEYAKKIIWSAVDDYFNEKNLIIEDFEVDFEDDCVIRNYGEHDESIIQVQECVYKRYGILLSRTYTAKAFTGMIKYVEKNNIKNKNILFLNTGGIPLCFDDIMEEK